MFADWYQKAPKLIPLREHRFVLNNFKHYPVLSIYGSDIIVFGWNMRHYLLNELKEHLGLHQLVYDEEYDTWYTEPSIEFKELNNSEFKKAKDKAIPVGEEMILH